jgi:hypothetical protein
MPPGTDPIAAELTAIEQRQEHGDLREFATADSPRLLAALEAVRTIACGWTAEAKDVPLIARDLAADVITGILTRELLGEGAVDERG